MKEINLRDYYPFYTNDLTVEVPDEVADLLREYTLLEEAYRIRTYRYKAFYSLDYDGNIERDGNYGAAAHDGPALSRSGYINRETKTANLCTLLSWNEQCGHCQIRRL